MTAVSTFIVATSVSEWISHEMLHSLTRVAVGSDAILERFPIIARDWLTGFLPESLRWLVNSLLAIAAIILPLVAVPHAVLADPYVDNAVIDELFTELAGSQNAVDANEISILNTLIN